MRSIFSLLKKFVLRKLQKRGPRSGENQTPRRSPEQLQALVAKYQEAIRVNPEDGMGYYNLGEVYIELKRFSESVSTLKEAIRIKPKHRSAYYQLGRALVEMGRDEAAIETLEEARDLDPKSGVVNHLLATAHTHHAITLSGMKRTNEAIQHAKTALEIQSDHAPAYMALGECYSDMGRYQEALDTIGRALKMDDNLAVEAYFKFGNVYSKLGDPKKAIKKYKQAISASPKSALPHLRLGALYFKLEKYKEAVQPLEKALQMSPHLASEAHYKLGAALSRLARYREAEEPLREAVKKSPENQNVKDLLAEALVQNSSAFRKSSQVPEELDTLLEAVKFNSEHLMAHFFIGQAYDKLKNGQNAIVHTTIAKQIFAEKHQDEWMAKAMKALQMYYKKYNLNPEDFNKVRVPRKN